MEENVQTSVLFNSSIKKGIILGAIHTFYFLILYLFVQEKLAGLSTVAFIIVVNISYIIYCGIQYRKEIGGFIDYGSSFKLSFFIFLINGVFSLVFMVIIILIDPTIPELTAQSQIDTSIYWAQTFGAPAQTLDDMHEKMNIDELKKQYDLFGQIKGFGFAVIFYAITSLILALIIRKREPEVM